MYLRMGQPGIRRNVIVRRETRGTETSKYPEEKKSTETPSVAASEQGRAQTGGLRAAGVADPHKGKAPQWKRLGRRGREGETPVHEKEPNGRVSRVPRDTRNPVGSRVDHHPRLSTTERPIAHSTGRER